jgi:hypothetical protein
MPFNPSSLKNLRQYAGESAQQSAGDRPTVEQPESVTVPEDQGVAVERAAEALARGAPAAAEYLNKVVSGAVRVPPHVRVQAATIVLEANGLRKQPDQRPKPWIASPAAQALASKLAKALGMPDPTVPLTVDGESRREPSMRELVGEARKPDSAA